jgi:hypothetical protein
VLTVSDAQIRPEPKIWFLLPPHVGMSDLTQNQQRLQPFPHSMSRSEGLFTWTLNIAVFLIAINLLWSPFYHILLDVAAYGWTSTFAYAYLVLGAIYYIFNLNSYPLVYAIVLRWTNASWPTTSEVWKSSDLRNEELLHPHECVTWLEKVLVWARQFLGYTHFGSLLIATLDRFSGRQHLPDGAYPDIERCEKAVQIELVME